MTWTVASWSPVLISPLLGCYLALLAMIARQHGRGVAVGVSECDDGRYLSVSPRGAPLGTDPATDSSRRPGTSTRHLPRVWSVVFNELKEVLQQSCHEELAAAPTIAQGCRSFSECRQLSKRHLLRLDVDAIGSVGRDQLGLGHGVDEEMLSGTSLSSGAWGSGMPSRSCRRS